MPLFTSGCNDSNAAEPIIESPLQDSGEEQDEEEGGDPFIPDDPLYNLEQWFRDLRVGHWLSGGATIEEITPVLTRISQAEGERSKEDKLDTLTDTIWSWPLGVRME